MKLLAKTRQYYLIYFLAILAVWTVVFAMSIKWVISTSVDQALITEKTYVIKELHHIKHFSGFLNDELLIMERSDTSKSIPDKFSNLRLYNYAENEMTPYRQLVTGVRVNGKPYKLVIRKSLIESDDMYSTIIVTEMILVVLLMIGFYFINRGIISRLWRPFYQTLDTVKNYKLASSESVSFSETSIDEFRELNTVLDKMTLKIHGDYVRLKEFTGNASHEMQTPLSIIKAKLELLLQERNLNTNQLSLIHSVSQAATRLSRMNQALLLLAKIENNQFPKFEDIDLSEIIRTKLENLEDFIEMKDITLQLNLQESVLIRMNSYLAEVLIGNLINNAIRHNVKGGHITLNLSSKSLNISNPGAKPKIEPSAYFNRFQKSGADVESIGLGLSIVKAICELYDFNISYEFVDPNHIITISFPDKNLIES